MINDYDAYKLTIFFFWGGMRDFMGSFLISINKRINVKGEIYHSKKKSRICYWTVDIVKCEIQFENEFTQHAYNILCRFPCVLRACFSVFRYALHPTHHTPIPFISSTFYYHQFFFLLLSLPNEVTHARTFRTSNLINLHRYWILFWMIENYNTSGARVTYRSLTML